MLTLDVLNYVEEAFKNISVFINSNHLYEYTHESPWPVNIIYLYLKVHCRQAINSHAIELPLLTCQGSLPKEANHYSEWAQWRLKSPASRLVTQPFIEIKNIKDPRHWPLCGEFTGEFPAQRVSNAEYDPIWWRHHDFFIQRTITIALFIVITGLKFEWHQGPCLLLDVISHPCPDFNGGFNLITARWFRAWISNCMLLFHVDVITNACLNLDVGLVILC